MSNNGVAHRVLDEMAKFEAKVSGKMSELINKHNELASKIAALEGVVGQVAAFAASEMGKAQGQVQGQMQVIGQSLSGIDLNVLALAELNKEVIGQLTQIDAFFNKLKDIDARVNLDLSDEDINRVRADAEAWYADLLKSSFQKAQEKIRKQEQEAAEARAAQQAQAEAEAKAQAEKDSVEAELKKAEEDERRVVTGSVSGGEGSPFPEGADIFGG